MRANASYLDRLVRHYGVTEDPGLGGYLLPDGMFLDFSGGATNRIKDHREITFVLPGGWSSQFDNQTDGMVRVCQRAGIIRWIPESWQADVYTTPTSEQLEVLRQLGSIAPIGVEASSGKRRYVNWYGPRQGRIAAEHLYEFFYHGRIPPKIDAGWW